jgi:hypothetical protein
MTTAMTGTRGTNLPQAKAGPQPHISGLPGLRTASVVQTNSHLPSAHPMMGLQVKGSYLDKATTSRSFTCNPQCVVQTLPRACRLVCKPRSHTRIHSSRNAPSNHLPHPSPTIFFTPSVIQVISYYILRAICHIQAPPHSSTHKSLPWPVPTTSLGPYVTSKSNNTI